MLVGGYYYDIPNDEKTIHTLQTVAMFNLNSKEWQLTALSDRALVMLCLACPEKSLIHHI